MQDVLKSLPHGPEFRFLDRVVSMVPGQTGVGDYKVRGEEYYLRGHFPNEPVFPGVLMVEAGAQLAGLVVQAKPTVKPLEQLKLTALRSVKFFGSARPGETVLIKATILGRLGTLIQAKMSASVAGVQVMSGELVLSGTTVTSTPGTPNSDRAQ